MVARWQVEGLRFLWERGIRSFEITALCDTERQRTEDVAEEIAEFQGTRPRLYSHTEEMLSCEDELEAVYICSPPRSHLEIAILCLEAGKHVSIEKPLALTIRSGRLILEAEERSGCVLQVAENMRRSPFERAINWAIKQKRIGDLRMMYWINGEEHAWYGGWRHHKEQAGGGYTFDSGVHYADIFRYSVGEVKELYAVSKTYVPVRYRDMESMEGPVEITVEDCTMATLEFENGVVGSWICTSSAPGDVGHHRSFIGDSGSIHLDRGLISRDGNLSMGELEREYMESLSSEERERLFPSGVTDTYAIELMEFFDAVRGKGEIETTGIEGLKAMAICMAVYESAALNTPVRIRDVEECVIEEYQAELNRGLGLV